MDFDNRKVYGDISISDGLVYLCVNNFTLVKMCLIFTLFENLVMVVCRSVLVLPTSLLLPEVLASVMTGIDLDISG